MKETNRYFSTIFFAVGVIKVIIMFIAFTNATTQITNIMSGREIGVTDTSFITLVASILAYIQIALVPASIVMMILNRNDTQYIPGYLIALGAFVSELIFSSLFLCWIAPVLYMRAGNYLSKKCDNSSSYRRYY